MIIYTKAGPTNSATGEILDLSALRRKPRGGRTRRVKQGSESTFWIALIALLLASMSLAF